MKLAVSFLIFIFCACPLLAYYSDPCAEQVFTSIYDTKAWGVNAEGVAWSGSGSAIQTTVVYRNFIQNFLKECAITSVVDLGCGDWEFSRLINWDGIDYKGFDVVESIIAKNQLGYQKENIHFYKKDALQEELPVADLLICKDVLQHLTNQDILRLIKQFEKYKYCLITNDIDGNTLSSENPDIVRGDYRRVDLTRAPFNVKGIKVLRFQSQCNLKQMLLIINR